MRRRTRRSTRARPTPTPSPTARPTTTTSGPTTSRRRISPWKRRPSGVPAMRFKHEWLEMEDAMFDVTLQGWLKDLKGVKYASSTRKEHVREAVDIVTTLAKLQYQEHYTQHPKFRTLSSQYRAL